MLAPTADVDDEALMKILRSLCEILGVSFPKLTEVAGVYMVNEYLPDAYGQYYEEADSAKEFLLKMRRVHKDMTRNIPGANPPEFDYEERGEKTLIMTYKSHRHLIDFMIGLIKGVGKYYGEDLDVTKIGGRTVKIVFP